MTKGLKNALTSTKFIILFSTLCMVVLTITSACNRPAASTQEVPKPHYLTKQYVQYADCLADYPQQPPHLQRTKINTNKALALSQMMVLRSARCRHKEPGPILQRSSRLKSVAANRLNHDQCIDESSAWFAERYKVKHHSMTKGWTTHYMTALYAETVCAP